MVEDLSSVDAARWDALDHGGSPFLEYGFLRALERSGSIGADSGWRPRFVLIESGDALLGAVAAFLKDHSYGEYIFDWAWARASERAGLPYYPKLVIAAPVTPATGPRLLIAPDAPRAEVIAGLVIAVRELAAAEGCSSVHWLFTTGEEQTELAAHGFSPRASFQFHWQNRGYADFDAFLAALTSRRRKQIRKERARARGAVDELEFIHGRDLTGDDVAAIDRYYRQTVWAHGGIDYLRPGFFHALRELTPDRVRFARVRVGGETVAGALYLQTERNLYGRYWGCDRELDCLHFETAYYAGIEHAIREGLSLFEAGAQGEHKLLRGFSPAPTYSSHWIAHPGLDAAVREFLTHEATHLAAYMAELEGLSPYRRG
ncbi:MAG: GNAT family N-acetyltransferase [Myxococcales bacterium]|nr:GNAT family N-acetyltransferase [Myxococcales bacterium]